MMFWFVILRPILILIKYINNAEKRARLKLPRTAPMHVHTILVKVSVSAKQIIVQVVVMGVPVLKTATSSGRLAAERIAVRHVRIVS